MTHVWLAPALTEMTGNGVIAPVGELELASIYLEPSWRLIFDPQHVRYTDTRREHECKLPNDTEATPDSRPKTKAGFFCSVWCPKPSCPWSFLPQQERAPDEWIQHEWPLPHYTLTTLSKEPVSVSCTDADGGTNVETSEDILSS
jgi:hypothetical protein